MNINIYQPYHTRQKDIIISILRSSLYHLFFTYTFKQTRIYHTPTITEQVSIYGVCLSVPELCLYICYVPTPAPYPRINNIGICLYVYE
jgi:hypothetical protein